MIGDLQKRISKGEVIILDGGTGTELEQCGVPMDKAAWSAGAILTHPEIVRRVHEDYIQAGAEIIITNTFSTSKHVLEPAGLSRKFREINARAVELARQARENVADKPVYIAGSISTTTFFREQPPAPIAKANFEVQAAILAEAGVDLIMLEMMRDVKYTKIVFEAAQKTLLPVWVGFSCVVEDGQVMLWNKRESLADGLAALPSQSSGVLVSIMHTLTEDIPLALKELEQGWKGPKGVYAHSGDFVMPNWQFIDMITPEEYVKEAIKWVQNGVQLIGGCCGIGPDHIRHLKERLPTHIPKTSI